MAELQIERSKLIEAIRQALAGIDRSVKAAGRFQELADDEWRTVYDEQARLRAYLDHAGVTIGDGISGLEDAARRFVAESALAGHVPGRAVIQGHLCAAHEAHRHFSISSTEAASVRACPDCTADVYVSCAGCGPQMRLGSCPVRSAIAALTGERAPDGT